MTSDVDLSGTWRAAPADEAARRDYHDPAFDDTRLGPRHGARALAVEPGVRRHRRPGAATARRSHAGAVRTRRPGRRRGDGRPTGGPGWCSTASSTRATSGSTAPTWATPRATSSPTRSRSPSAGRGAAEHMLALEVACPRPTDLTRQAQPDRRVPALGPARPRLEPGRHLAAGAPRAVRARCASSHCPGAVPRRRPTSAAIVSLRAVLDTVEARDRRPASRRSPPDAATTRRAGRRHRRTPAAGRRREPGRVDRDRARARSLLVAPRARRPAALRRARRRSRTADGRGRATSGARPHRPALGRARDDWIFSVNGERLFLKGANQGPTRMALAEADRRRAGRATSTLARDAGPRLPPRARPRQPARALRRGRRGRPAALAGPARCSGATAARVRRQARRQAREAVDLLGPPPVACSCGAATTSRWPLDVEPGDAGRPTPAPARSWRGWLAAQAAADVEQDGARPRHQARARDATTAPDRWSPTPACSPTRPSSTAPTPTSTSVGTTATSATCPALLARWPRLARFVSEFGAQAVPDHDDFVRARALARPRLGRGWPSATRCRSRCSTATCRRPTFATVRRVEGGHAALPGRVVTLPRRDPAATQVPADRRLRPVLLRRRLARGDAVGARPRAAAQAGLRRPCATPAGR